jgi:hypothetical protein
MGTRQYLRVNIHPGSDRWILSLCIMEWGRPYPREIRTVYHGPLTEGLPLLSQAAQAAAAVLLAEFPDQSEH